MGIQKYQKLGMKMSYFSTKYYKKSSKGIFLCVVQWPHALYLLLVQACIFLSDTFVWLFFLTSTSIFCLLQHQTRFSLGWNKFDFQVIFKHQKKLNSKIQFHKQKEGIKLFYDLNYILYMAVMFYQETFWCVGLLYCMKYSAERSTPILV